MTMPINLHPQYITNEEGKRVPKNAEEEKRMKLEEEWNKRHRN